MDPPPGYDAVIDVKHLARFLFLENDGRPCSLSFDGIEDARDLFCFCLELLTKGMALLYGDATGCVRLSQLSNQQFETVCTKLACAGIRCIWDVHESSPSEDDAPMHGEARLEDGQEDHVMRLVSLPPGLPFEEYVFVLRRHGVCITVRFEVERVI